MNEDTRLERVRAFVNIQDGCSCSCGFCVISLVRGGTRSRTADAVLREIRRRVDQGHTEIVLTGINLGCFRDREAGFTLARLVRAAGETPGLARLRLSSIEINHVDSELVAALRETPTVARADGQTGIRVSSPPTDLLSEATYVSTVLFSSRYTSRPVPPPLVPGAPIHKGRATSVRSAPEERKRLSGDQLRICIAPRSKRPRPAYFELGGQSQDVTLLVLRRLG